MQLQELNVRGLFHRFNHCIPFPMRDEDDATPTVVLLHGPNGVGKTTVLRMLNGAMELDFDTFRATPVESLDLLFNTGQKLTVKKSLEKESDPLEIQFEEWSALLHPEEKGAFSDEDEEDVRNLRAAFDTATQSLDFDFIETSRTPAPAEQDPDALEVYYSKTGRVVRRRSTSAPTMLARRVRRFISEAQVSSREFFTSSEPDLFARILRRLQEQALPSYNANELVASLRDIHDEDVRYSRLGLQPDHWDYESLVEYLRPPGTNSEVSEQVLAVVGAYVDVLAARSSERRLLAERLTSFEEVLSDMFTWKDVRISGRDGFQIITDDGVRLREDQLSSGEYHLLYLMVSALVARRRGTIIAIDEPEISMHIEWQSRLVDSLFSVASNAAPQFILATHSPDVVANYRDFMVGLTPTED